MSTKNICTYPLLSNMGVRTNAIVEQDGKLHRVNLDHEFTNKANSVFCEASGENIMLENAAAAKFKNIILCGKTKQKSYNGKNLLQVTGGSDVISGVTFTANKDGSITVDGTATASINYVLSKAGISVIENNTEYLLTGCPAGGGSGIYELRISDLVTKAHVHYGGDAIKFSYADASELTAYIRINAGVTVSNLTFYPMISKNGGEYEPYTGGKAAPNPDYPQEIVSVENTELFVVGKNIFGGDALADKIVSVSKATTSTKDEETGIVTYSGGGIDKAVILDYGFKKNQQYTLILYGQNTTALAGYINISFLHDDNTLTATKMFETHGEDSYAVLTSEAGKTVKAIVGKWASGTVYLHYNKSGLFEGVVSKEYFEEYIPEQNISFTHKLHGIPVSSGGNYTDSNGKQWICDEIDLERGVLVQRVKELVLNGSENWLISSGIYLYIDLKEHAIKGGEGFCSHFDFWYNYGGDCVFASERWLYLGKVASDRYGLNVAAWKEFLASNHVTVCYILAEPVEIPLTDSEIYAFKNTYSNYPNTTILNDEEAWMKVVYSVDLKKYIESLVIAPVPSLVDTVTGKTYVLQVTNGKLTMEEVN